MTSTIYVAEFFGEKGRWSPCDGATAMRSREGAKQEMEQFQADNPDVKFRIAVYERVDA